MLRWTTKTPCLPATFKGKDWGGSLYFSDRQIAPGKLGAKIDCEGRTFSISDLRDLREALTEVIRHLENE